MNNSATKHEKRGKPHNMKKKVLLTISLLIILITTSILQDGTIYESMARGGSQSESSNAITSEEAQPKDDPLDMDADDENQMDESSVADKKQIDEQSPVDNTSDSKVEEPKEDNKQEVILQSSSEAWNMAFNDFNERYAIVNEEPFPTDTALESWIVELQKKDLYCEPKDHTPLAGELVFFYKNEDAKQLYVGITAPKEENNISEKLTIIVNSDKEQKEEVVSSEYIEIIGYGVLPEVVDVNEPETPGSGDISIAEPEKTTTPVPSMKAAKAPSKSAAVKSFAVNAAAVPPATINTVDSKSEGIILNLFDYTGSGLDSNSNTVDRPVYSGINGTSSSKRDFLFLGTGSHNGGYTDAEMINVFTDGKKARQGIVRNTLYNNYPVLAVGNGSSLNYLFDSGNVVGKTIYPDVNHLFKMQNGYYVYDSNANYAYYNNSSGGDFTVYDGTYNESGGAKIGFFPFNEYNSSNTNIAPGGGYNHHFGLTMECNFLQAEDGKVDNQDMIFEFSGDDDVWVFIDDVLVLDLGGIHQEVKGTINFRSGDVTVGSAVDLRNNSVASQREISDIFAKAGKTYNSNTMSEHKLRFFYLERGSNYSNNMIKFNLPTGLHISKNIKGENAKNYYDKDYTFQLYVEDKVNTGVYKLYNSSKAYYDNTKDESHKVAFSNGTFKMKARQTVDIYDISPNKKYYVKEVDVDTDTYSDVMINNTIATKIDTNKQAGTFAVKSEDSKVAQQSHISFDNILREKYKDIIVKKMWKNSDGTTKTDNLPSSITAKLKQKDKKTGEVISTDNIILNNTNGWTATYTHKPVIIGDKEYEYLVEEVSVPAGYVVQPLDIINTDSNTTITMTNKVQPFKLNVVKKWFKPDGTEKKEGFPRQLSVTLYKSTTKADSKPKDSIMVGQSVQLTATNSWTHTWKDTDLGMEAYDQYGNPYYYYVVEESLSDYSVEYSNNGVSVANAIDGVTISIKNTCKYIDNVTFPEAGGRGTLVYTVTGMLLLAFSIFLLFVVTNKRRCK